MNYKTYCKNNEILSIKLRIIISRIRDGTQIKDISCKYSMGRNTVTNIMNLYNKWASDELKNKIISWDHFLKEDIDRLCSFLLPNSRRPKSNCKQATADEEKKIITDFWKVKVWAKRLLTILKRKKEIWNFTLAKVKWIYKRNDFRVQKVRTKNWETRSLYNYQKIWAFEDIHYDTKILADAKSLPADIYENLKYNEHLPIYEWNIIDVASRSRFIAYSRWKSSTFWLQFLVFTISHLRYCWITNHIRIHTDWGSEFFSWSERKQVDWNSVLKELDADIDCYNPDWDIRKNLIERSHRSDDEEFLIPFWETMKTKEQFMIQAQEYSDYWNKLRSHSWKWMNGKTPREKLLSLWIHQADRILNFEVLHLDSNFYNLQQHLQFFLLQRDFKILKQKSSWKEDRKWHLDLITKYPNQILKDYAQNVLTYYQN